MNPIYVIKEEFREGWKIVGARYGESQTWAILLHPLEFTLEIHMDKFIELTQTISIHRGLLEGKFKYDKYNNTLIQF